MAMTSVTKSASHNIALIRLEKLTDGSRPQSVSLQAPPVTNCNWRRPLGLQADPAVGRAK